MWCQGTISVSSKEFVDCVAIHILHGMDLLWSGAAFPCCDATSEPYVLEIGVGRCLATDLLDKTGLDYLNNLRNKLI